MPETSVNISEKLQKFGQTAQDYKNIVMEHFKDMDVEIKDWNFNFGKNENSYDVEVRIKLSIKPKA
jgi:hypothetical protein